MTDLYKLANPADEANSSEWLEVQKLAIADNAESDKILTKKVLEAQHASVRLPIVRQAMKSRDVTNAKGEALFSVAKDETIICDIVRNLLLVTSPSMLTRSISALSKTKAFGRLQRKRLPNLPNKLHLEIR